MNDRVTYRNLKYSRTINNGNGRKIIQFLRIWTYLLAFLPIACGIAGNVQTLIVNDKRIEIRAEVVPVLIKFNETESKIEGKLSIQNRSTIVQRYSNRNLILKLNDKLIARAYQNSIASHAIDYSDIEIPAGSSLTLNVYWVFPLHPETPVENLRLQCN